MQWPNMWLMMRKKFTIDYENVKETVGVDLKTKKKAFRVDVEDAGEALRDALDQVDRDRKWSEVDDVDLKPDVLIEEENEKVI